MAHPDQLGKYRITGVLGEGAMGVVYRGFDPDIRRVVALKTIRRSGEGGESAAVSAARFRNEARSAGRLTHPGVVGVYDFGESDSPSGRVTYIAMEYVEGHNLAAYLARPVRFCVSDIASITAQLLDALSHAHEHAVWHRDIKPANIIVTRGGRVKIADFGIARYDDSGLTMAGGMVGTPIYMSPEQYLGTTIDHRVDLYAVGVVLYQLIVGRPPFTGDAGMLSYRVVHEEAALPSRTEGAALVLPQLDSVVLRALAKRPEERYATAGAFRAALEAALGQAAAPALSRAAVDAMAPNHDQDATLLVPDRSRAVPPGAGLGSRLAAALPASGPVGPAGPAGGSSGAASALVTHWDAAVLAQLEAMLARHVGPLASTMVRRAARECTDLSALQARLAEQITQASVREAFLTQIRASATGSGAGAAHRSGTMSALPGNASQGGASGTRRSSPAATGLAAAPPTGGSASGGMVSEAWLEQAQKVLAQHLGPIARVVLRRACERTRQRLPLVDLLVEAAPEPARKRLFAELERLV